MLPNPTRLTNTTNGGLIQIGTYIVRSVAGSTYTRVETTGNLVKFQNCPAAVIGNENWQ